MGSKLKNVEPTFDTLSIPSFAGRQQVTSRFQRRTQVQYAGLFLLGLVGFYGSSNPHTRVLGLSCFFPGAGFLGIGGILGAIGLVLSLLALPLSLFAWFGAGGLAFVYANWLIPGFVASAIARSVWEPSAPIAMFLSAVACSYMIIGGQRRHAAALNLRQDRNSFLDAEDAKWRARTSKQMRERKDELSREELRLLQHFVQLAHQSFDDWSNFVRIDQFQTSALRYQLYDMQYTFAYVQKHFMPNFHSYLKTAQENVIEKSLVKDVMHYWKWESLWGKFTMDWDPVVRDNIMVTGYILICLATYEKLTGDPRYSKDGSLEFVITEKARYKHNTDTILDALMRNWNQSPYCFFPCEPNWIYSACNLVGMQGALAYDSYKKSGKVAPVLTDKYYRGFEEDFVNPDGGVVALRSAITGWQMAGIAGVVGDIGGALTSAASMPNVARRLWLMSRKSNIKKIDGSWGLVNLVGADNIDVGNYKAGVGFAHALSSFCAVEFGERDIQSDLIRKIDQDLHPIVDSPTGKGALMNGGLSVLAMGYLFRGRIGIPGGWSDLINCPRDEKSLAAPKLDSVPFPDVMVARCRAHGDTGLDFVLRGPETAKSFVVAFKDLKIGAVYVLNAVGTNHEREVVSSKIIADADGVARITILVGDRSEFDLRIA